MALDMRTDHLHQAEDGRLQRQKPSDVQVAYKLLVELLAYQFAFPVQWIDTQKELLSATSGVQRVVEIGPANILSSMAKKASKSLAAKDRSYAGRNREFLFVNDVEDAKKINYEYEAEESSPSSEPDNSGGVIVSDDPASGTVASVAPKSIPQAVECTEVIPAKPVAEATLPATASAMVTDVDLDPTVIMLSIIGQKLHRRFDEVAVKDSIRTLSRGKSTLQNEIVGDLVAEFGDLPDGVEGLTLEELGSTLGQSFSKKPGKHVKKLMERVVSSKMPGGFNKAAMETYLHRRWGLGPNRQTAVLCFCVTMEPSVRLASEQQAQEFLDSVVARYADHAGIPLQQLGPRQGDAVLAQQDSDQASVRVDAASLEALKRDQMGYLSKISHVLTQYLGAEEAQNSTSTASEAGLDSQDDPRLRQMSTWLSELDEEFLEGVQGIFDPRKERRYASWWNWVRQDLVRMRQAAHLQHLEGARVLSVAPGSSIDDEVAPYQATDEQIRSLVNRWTPGLEDMLQHLTKERPTRTLAASLLSCKPLDASRPLFRYSQPAMAPRTIVDDQGRVEYSEVPRPDSSGSTYYNAVASGGRATRQPHVPCLNIRTRHVADGSWRYSPPSTETYMKALEAGTSLGLNFTGKTALVTGAGPGSIGAEVVKGLLSGGATVFCTTSRAPSAAADFYCSLYRQFGARGAELVLVPFNAASRRDCEQLVARIFDGSSRSGPGTDLDFVLPFAAMPENGRDVDGIDARSELAHRAMLVNVLRMLGCVKQAKQRRRSSTKPTSVVLPLSPNHGDFGGDGLYSESKIGLETLFQRAESEGWARSLAIIGAVIGWTRGTGLMSANNIVAEGIEARGVTTFTAAEMAFNILALLSPPMLTISDSGPLYADLSGGLLGFPALKDEILSIRADITTRRRIRQAITAERIRQDAVLHGADEPASLSSTKTALKKRSNIRQPFPQLSAHAEMTAGLESLVGMVDLSSTVVVVGFSELGPWGSSRTRWQMESAGAFDVNGLTEMAWIMGLVQHVDGSVDGKPYIGWVDKKTGQPVHEADFAALYREHIMAHAGIRVMEPGEHLDGYDPENKELLHEIVLTEDLQPFEAPESLARSLKLRQPDKTTIRPGKAPETWMVSIQRGATFLVPKSTSTSLVAAQLPTGWNPATYGIPEDIVSQVDPITLYVLCCVCEAMYSAGIEDPFEIYKHIHISEFLNCVGTGAGGLRSMRAMYRHRYLDKPVQGDILQETFLNSMAAWTNMLIFGSTGPIKTPTGTCATAIESLDTACEALKAGTVKMALVGGTDDLQEEMSHEFSNMKATCVAADETAKGFAPAHMSRPTASSRAGFVESAGAGVQLVTTAALALEMGLPIYGVVAYTQMAGDGVGRSVPAPGQGVLTAARETAAARESPVLDVAYRRARLREQLAQIESRRSLAMLVGAGGGANRDAQVMEAEAARSRQDALRRWNGNIRLLDPNISPMRAALSAWGLGVDDIQVASFHGTSTKANDKNESHVINQQMEHLGRSRGNPLLVVCQKHLTGHPKGAAGAWMLNGCLQVLESGLVPGNRNADDIDVALEEFEHLVYLSESVQLPAIKAFMLTSFGFGQKGGIVIGVAPRLLFAALSADGFESYRTRVNKRRGRIDRVFQLDLMRNSLFKAKETSPWSTVAGGANSAFLDPT